MISTVVVILVICAIIGYVCCCAGGKADKDVELQYYEYIKSKNKK